MVTLIDTLNARASEPRSSEDRAVRHPEKQNRPDTPVLRKPEWLRTKVRIGEGFLGLKHTMRDLGLVTVCEEAGCPNIFECWAAGTATFMINGERCTRACGFCLVDTRHPLPLDVDEPELSESPPEPGLDDAYRSLYHPPPFSTKPAADSCFSTLPPHFSHFVFGGSLMDCMYSKTFLHFPWHWYS